MRIGNREIAADQPPYIIAELGVNHDGSVDRALELTRAAAASGADAVKLQLFETDRLMSKAAKLAAYQKAAGETDPIAMLRRLELSIDDMSRVVDLAHEIGIHAIVTVFSVELVARAETLPWDAYKTASPDIVHKPLLEALAATGKPMIVSTGASTMDEVKQAVGWLTDLHPPTTPSEPRPSGSGPLAPGPQGRPLGSERHLPPLDRLALMQCVSCYPTHARDASLVGIIELAGLIHGVRIGYSDHTMLPETGALAVSLGAVLLEKHLTYDTSAAGPDHIASLSPTDFAKYVTQARSAPPWPALPKSAFGAKSVQSCEQDVRTISRQSITTRRALKSGETLRREDLTFKRPGTGILPFRLDELLGRELRKDIEADLPLSDTDLGW